MLQIMGQRRRSLRTLRRRNSRIRTALVVLSVVIALLLAGSLIYYHFMSANNNDYSTSKQLLPAAIKVINSKPSSSQGYVVEYSIQPDSSPNALAVDSSGNVWFSIGAYHALGELNPSNGTVHEYQLPLSSNASILTWGVAVDKSRNVVWFTDETSNSIWSFDMISHTFAKFSLPQPLSLPYQIAVDSSGNAWFTEIGTGRLGEITAQGALNEYDIPHTSSYNLSTNSTGPAGIAIDKDGTIWIAEAYANAIASFRDGEFHQYPIQGAESPTGIAIGEQGNIWITQHGGSYVSEYNPSSNSLTTISTSIPAGVTSSLPYFIQVDSSGNVWFTEHYGNAIARYTPSNSSMVEFRVPSRVQSLGNISGVLTLALSPLGQPWFTELYTGKIGTVNIAKPVGLDLNFLNFSGNAVDVPNGKEFSLKLSISNTQNFSDLRSQVFLSSSVGGSSDALSFDFIPQSGSDNFTSILTISNMSNQTSSSRAFYWVTISASSSELTANEIIQVET